MFLFGPHPDNPGVPTGSYLIKVFMLGEVVKVLAGDWVIQPPGYYTVNFEGQLSADGLSFAGEFIDALGCTTISLTHTLDGNGQAAVAIPPPAKMQSVGTWTGYFACISEYELRVTIRDDGTGTIALMPVPGSNPIEPGSFAITVTENAPSLLMQHGDWIDKIPAFDTFNMSGDISADGQSMSGEVGMGMCEGFALKRGEATPAERKGMLAKLLPEKYGEKVVAGVTTEAPELLGSGTYYASGQCAAHPATLTFDIADGKLVGLKSPQGEAKLVEWKGPEYLFKTGEDDSEILVRVAKSGDVFLLNHATRYDCISRYTVDEAAASATDTSIDVSRLPVEKLPVAARDREVPLGLAKVGGLALGMSYDEALAKLISFQVAAAGKTKRSEIQGSDVEVKPGAFVRQDSGTHGFSANLNLGLVWDDRGNHVAFIVKFVTGTNGEATAASIEYQTSTYDIQPDVVAALGKNGMIDVQGRTYWMERQDLAWAIKDATDCRYGYEAPGEPNCGTLVMSQPGLLLIIDSAETASRTGASEPVKKQPRASIAGGVALEDPVGDIGDYFAKKKPFKFNRYGVMFAAGFAAELLDKCSLDLENEDYTELYTLLQSGGTAGAAGTDYSNPDVFKAWRSQHASIAAISAGTLAARQTGCAEPDATKMAEFIIDLIKANREGENNFIATCSAALSEPQCTCFAAMAIGVYPDIYQRKYQRSIIAGFVEANPFLAFQMAAKCNISYY